MRRSGLLLSLALGSGLVACSSDSKTEESAPADTGCNLFTGEGCEDASDTGASDTGGSDTGVSDTGGSDTGASDTGSTDTGSANAGVESQALLDFCADAIDSVCDHLYDCADEFADQRAEFETAFGFFDKESCKSSLPTLFDPLCDPEANAAAGGRVRRDTARFDRCVAFAAVDDCATYLANTAESDLCFALLPVEGTVPNGGNCARNSECADPLSRCSAIDPTASTAPGVCEPALGASCLDATTCLSTQYCDQPGNDWEVAAGIRGVCAPRSGEGAACEDLYGCIDPLGCSGDQGYAANGEPVSGRCQ